jgi:hypothetical protein
MPLKQHCAPMTALAVLMSKRPNPPHTGATLRNVDRVDQCMRDRHSRITPVARLVY